MIAPGVRMHGFVSPSFARLSALAAKRQATRPRELHVLHDRGEVLAVVDTSSGPIREPLPSLDAHQLRKRYGVDRVIVADAEPLREMLAGVEANVTAEWTQPDVFVALQRGFRDCPGVVCDPPMKPVDGWDALRDVMSEAGDGRFVIATTDGDIAVGGRIAGGVLVEVTDATPHVDDSTVLAIVTTTAALEAALTADDVATALLDLAGSPDPRKACT